jgi:hypothetical protein
MEQPQHQHSQQQPRAVGLLHYDQLKQQVRDMKAEARTLTAAKTSEREVGVCAVWCCLCV